MISDNQKGLESKQDFTGIVGSREDVFKCGNECCNFENILCKKQVEGA
jgi:hypothetical protein